MVHSALKDCDIVAVGNYGGHPDSKIKDWVQAARGKISFQPKITDHTTHIIVAEKQWKTQPAVVKDALKRSEQSQKIHIVSFDWLDDSLHAKAKRAESSYSWVKKARAAMKAKGPKVQPRSTAGLMSQVFAESTEGFLSEAAKNKMAKRWQMEEDERKEDEKRKQEAFKEQRESESLKILQDLFKRGITKKRNELITDKHHIYVDGKSFRLDVVLEPVDKTGGPDDPPNVSLQIYESKTEPPTYAFNAKAHHTSKLPQNNIIVCIGCNFLTASRLFSNIFKEYTGVEWASRANASPEESGAKYRYVAPKAELMQERGGEDKSRMSSPENSAASSLTQESKKLADVGGDDMQEDRPPKTALQRLEAKAAQRALTNQFDKETLAAGNSSLGKRKEVEDSTPEDSEDEPPSKLRKSKGNRASGTP
ncbi:hypothetical protein M409DRAFT_20320 [Zasmidium cellare ATCC 36951]|uniref:BRCT domain-containing protein n=1 Tax=Zasmidium cellare ATCC 36951 TaxID=1080233 RepID=A0A6A6CRK1_ZASCE|nr:uncharacterized protein M409DRAFT_20320 [Zasmidium cellare ATCC 36951]KAF2169907.1 hypothetical protein M409DRAFT_20320 [Zasmidium cellare ATCC 36951]